VSEQLVTIASEAVEVVVRPEKGADVLSLIDRASGVDVLWKAPWGQRTGFQYTPDSASYWTERSGGGWNLLLPHAGAERVEAGAPYTFHGEAGVVSWTVTEQSASAVTLTTGLMSAPLSILRRISVEDDVLTVDDTVTNDSRQPTRISWGHHPTFGAPLIAPGTRLEVPATSFEIDPAAPVIVAGIAGAERGSWPAAAGVDLSVVPPAGEPRAVLAYLTGLTEGRYRIVNDGLGLGVELTWPLDLFPNVWLWQELGGTPGYPWFTRGYCLALEPHSTIPQGGEPTLRIEGGESRSAAVTARITRG
jgi:galactose mutarotase-like enzyme